MQNTVDCYEALLRGEKLRERDYVKGAFIMISPKTRSLVNQDYNEAMCTFAHPEVWEIYKPVIEEAKMKLKHFNMLGMEVKDKVTGFKGVATSISYDLYGCIQFIVTPKVDKEGAAGKGQWFDSNRLEVIGTEPVMEVPNFDEGPVANGEKGGFEKPLQ